MIAVYVLVGLTALSVMSGAHWYLWKRLVRDVSVPGGWWRRTGTVLVFALPLITVATFITGRSGAPFVLERILAWPGFLWLAMMLYLLLTLLVGELVRPLLRRFLARRSAARTRPAAVTAAAATADTGATAAEPGTGGTLVTGPAPDAPDGEAPDGESPAPDPDPSRRLFIARTVAAGAVTVSAVTVGVGAYSVLNGPTVKRVTVPLAKLPRAGHGYRIAVASDIHLGPILGRSHAQRVVDAINGTRPDMVAIVGDLIDGTVDDLGPAARPLAQLRSRDGTYFVTGNHEYFSGDPGEWLEFLRDMGIRTLENARTELPAFDLAGVNDIAGESEGEGPDFTKALGGRDPKRASVLLAHQPVQIHDAVDHHVGLQLSGHTHGGQLWPGPLLAELANPTVAGLERYGDTQLYVSRGAGAWGPPVRVGADSDITVVTLASPHA